MAIIKFKLTLHHNIKSTIFSVISLRPIEQPDPFIPKLPKNPPITPLPTLHPHNLLITPSLTLDKLSFLPIPINKRLILVSSKQINNRLWPYNDKWLEMYNVNNKENKWFKIITSYCLNILRKSTWLYYGCCYFCWYDREKISGY